LLLFRSEEEIRQWCGQAGENYGEVLALAKVWDLAQLWYRPRMAPAYRGRTTQEAEQIFSQVGLVSSFWKF